MPWQVSRLRLSFSPQERGFPLGRRLFWLLMRSISFFNVCGLLPERMYLHVYVSGDDFRSSAPSCLPSQALSSLCNSFPGTLLCGPRRGLWSASSSFRGRGSILIEACRQRLLPLGVFIESFDEVSLSFYGEGCLVHLRASRRGLFRRLHLLP